jgi:hypothetical protein
MKTRGLPRRTGNDNSPDTKVEPLHSYALAQHIKRTSNDLLQIEEGSLYPALQRPSQGGVGESRMGHLVHKPSRSDLQIDTDRCEAS